MAHIIQLDGDISLCTGCSGCEIICGLLHDKACGPTSRRIFVEKDSTQLIHQVHTCQHCDDAPCLAACPEKIGAMKRGENGIVYVDKERCIGCGRCVKACPFSPKRIQLGFTGKAMKCDLCRDREDGPACINHCQVLCIQMSDAPLPSETNKEVS